MHAVRCDAGYSPILCGARPSKRLRERRPAAPGVVGRRVPGLARGQPVPPAGARPPTRIPPALRACRDLVATVAVMASSELKISLTANSQQKSLRAFPGENTRARLHRPAEKFHARRSSFLPLCTGSPCRTSQAPTIQGLKLRRALEGQDIPGMGNLNQNSNHQPTTSLRAQKQLLSKSKGRGVHGLQATAERPRHPAHKQGPNQNKNQVHGRVVVGGWVSSPAGQNRRTVGHCGRTKLPGTRIAVILWATR